MASFFDLVASLQSSIDDLDQVLSGDENETVLINGVNKDTISKAIKDNFSALQSLAQGRLTYETKALMDAAGAPALSELAEVWNDGTVNNNGLYGWDGSAWQASKFTANNNQVIRDNKNAPVTGYAVAQYIVDSVLSGRTRNLIKPENIRSGFYYSPGSDKIKPADVYRCTGFISVSEGQTYTYSGAQASDIGYFTEKSDDASAGAATNPFTVPFGQNIKYVVCNITGQGGDETSYDALIQLEVGALSTKREDYKELLPLLALEGAEQLLRKDWVYSNLFFKEFTNLFNLQKVNYQKRYSPGSLTLVNVDSMDLVACDYIPVTEGETYVISGAGFAGDGGYFSSNGVGDATRNISKKVVTGGSTFTVPEGENIQYVVFNLNSNTTKTAIIGDVQIDKGIEIRPPQAHAEQDKVLTELFPSPVDFGNNFIFDNSSINKINPDKIDYDNRYSPGQKVLVSDALGIAATEYIPVIEGEWYAISGSGFAGDGGYFSGQGVTLAIENIAFTNPVIGVGKVFLVPLGLNITHVVVTLKKLDGLAASTSLHDVVQLEQGEVASNFRGYSLEVKIKKKLIPSFDKLATFDKGAWYAFVNEESTSSLADKIPEFRSRWLKKDKDLVVVNTGTSLTARATEHCTEHAFAKTRPPLMHSRNFASHIFDALKWEGQEYRRYDTGFFTESGDFLTTYNLPEWDDGLYRQGWTRYSDDDNSSVSFIVPINAWQFNLIYRTDSAATDLAQVNVATGTGKIEVYDEENLLWVEANSYQFSMNEPEPQGRTISVPKATDGAFVSLYKASKGNTTYQKRLKMRCKGVGFDSRSQEKEVEISAVNAGRLLYWGVEWSSRQFMVSYINAARGSHNTQVDTTSRALPIYADNEVWGFKPDLMLFELPIHNDGAANSRAYEGGFFERAANNYVFNYDYELSMKTRSAYFGLNPEMVMFTSAISIQFGGVDDEGKMILTEQLDGQVMTPLDKFSSAHIWIKENHPEVVSINAAQRWVQAGDAIFGDLKSATQGSGKDGKTFTNEGGHWNNTGSAIIAKAILPALNFKY
jgi:hypothetical protein